MTGKPIPLSLERLRADESKSTLPILRVHRADVRDLRHLPFTIEREARTPRHARLANDRRRGGADRTGGHEDRGEDRRSRRVVEPRRYLVGPRGPAPACLESFLVVRPPEDEIEGLPVREPVEERETSCHEPIELLVIARFRMGQKESGVTHGLLPSPYSLVPTTPGALRARTPLRRSRPSECCRDGVDTALPRGTRCPRSRRETVAGVPAPRRGSPFFDRSRPSSCQTPFHDLATFASPANFTGSPYCAPSSAMHSSSSRASFDALHLQSGARSEERRVGKES